MQSGHPSEVHSRGMQRPSHVENDVEQLKVDVVVVEKIRPVLPSMSMKHVIDNLQENNTNMIIRMKALLHEIYLLEAPEEGIYYD